MTNKVRIHHPVLGVMEATITNVCITYDEDGSTGVVPPDWLELVAKKKSKSGRRPKRTR